jgi:copper chaperone
VFKRKRVAEQNSASTSNGTSRTYEVSGISCDHCKQAIEAQLAILEGVDSFSVDVEAKTVQVSGGEDADAVAAIEAAGYSVA